MEVARSENVERGVELADIYEKRGYAEKSAFLKDVLGETLLAAYLGEKKKALEEYEKDNKAYFQKEFERL